MFCKPYLKAKSIIRLISLVVVVAAVAIIPWANPSISSATAITVTNTNDNGPGSLRQAIIDAVSGDIINFSIPASDPGCTGGLCTITLASELAIEKSLTIQGPGANQLTVSGNHVARVFNIAAGNFTVTFSSLTIVSGVANGGGGISNNSTGTLNVIDTVLSGNAALACGGPIFDNKGGGAISNVGTGTLNVLNSTLSGNTACVLGGGIYNANTGAVNITGSTFSGNSAPGSCGGGIYNAFGVVTIINSTFSGNSNTNGPGGGAICNDGFGGSLHITNSTLFRNSAFSGGGIINISGATAVVKNTIIALNAASSSGSDVQGSFTSQGYNLIGANDGSNGFANGVNNDQVGSSNSPVDPLLAPLANNGGPTQTHALLAGSTAIDKGSAASITTDQRGLPRPVDDPLTPNAAGGDGSDIGAFEAQTPPIPTPTPTPTPTPVPATCVQPPPGSIAWWPLDETSGTIAADRVGNHPGAYANGPVPAAGKVRGALRFDGSNYVAVADSDQWAFGTSDFTIDLWANWDVPGSGSISEPGDILIGSDEGPGNRNKWFFALGGGVLDFTVYNVASPPSNFFLVRAPFSPVVGQWYHLAVTKRGTLFTIFVNGIAVGSEVSSSPIANANAPLTIGQAENIGFMNGRLDEVSVSNRALTQEELKAIFDAGSAGKCINLSISPNRGGDTGNISVHINGTGFAQGAIVKLIKVGQGDIAGNPVKVGDDGTTIDTTFELTGKTRGTWNVVVTNPDNSTQFLQGGFTIELGQEPHTFVELLGLNLIRPSREQTYWLVLRNEGNTDIEEPVGLISWPSGSSLVLSGAVTAYSEPAPSPIVENGRQALGFFLPKIPAGETRYFPVRFTTTTTIGQDVSLLTASLPVNFFQNRTSLSLKADAQSGKDNPPIGSTVFMGPHGNNPYGHEGVVGQLNGTIGVWDNWQEEFVEFEDWKQRVGGQYLGWGTPPGWTEQKGNQANEYARQIFMGGVPNWEWNCGKNDSTGCYSCSGLVEHIYEGAGLNPLPTPYDPIFLTPGAHYELFTGKNDFYSNAEIDPDLRGLVPWWVNIAADFYGGNLIDTLRQRGLAAEHKLTVISSFDPNSKSGSTGVGDERYLSLSHPSTYLVSFENLETATAPAQEVVITDQLDTVNMDLSTLSLGPISFGNHQVIPPPGASAFATDVDLRPEKNLIVRITANLNPNTGLLTWRFASIDPATGNPPEDPLAGFLPPDINPPEGDGSVLFTVMPKKDLATGTTIRNKARIVFDVNEPIDTPEWFNTIDNSKPISNVLPLTASQCPSNVQVQWAGTDEGSGIASYNIYVSDNGAPFSVWQQNTTATSGIYTGQFGHTYAFYSVAQDKTGNIEDAPANPDATVTLNDNTPPTITTESPRPASLWPPNHTMRDVLVNYTVMDNCSSTCTLRVTSNEPVNGTGDGDTAPDWEIVDAHHVRLRAERAAIGNGRKYTITVTCTDSAGNSTSKDVAVFVSP